MRRTSTRHAVKALGAAAVVGALSFVVVPSASAFADATPRHQPPADATATTTVRRGSTGFRVLQVQYVLRSLGYQIAADGRFGPGTEAAVKQFQASKGLQADGIVGPRTSAALGLASTSAPAATPAPSTPAAPADSSAIYQHPKANVERWHAEALAAGWTEAEWQTLSCIINRESGGIPTAKNRSSGAAGLLQIMWSAHYSWIGGSAEQLLDGPTNLRLGRALFLRSGWSPWKSTHRAC